MNVKILINNVQLMVMVLVYVKICKNAVNIKMLKVVKLIKKEFKKMKKNKSHQQVNVYGIIRQMNVKMLIVQI